MRCSDNTRSEVLAVLEVRASREGGVEEVLARREVRATDFPRANEWHVFPLRADVREGDDVVISVEFRSGVADLWCDWVRIQPLAPVGDSMLDISPEFWRDSLTEPIRLSRPLAIGPLRLRGRGSPARPLRLLPRGLAELGPGKGFRLRLGDREAILIGPDGHENLSLRPDGLSLQVPGRRLVIGPSSVRFERYDEQLGAWVEQMTPDLVEKWRDEGDPDKISMRALRSYPLGPRDISVPGLDADGRLS